MASPITLETRGEHKLSAMDKTEERLKGLQRAQWLRAAILGANDGLLSTTSLMLGVGAAKEDQRSMVLSGIAGAIAGACSMAVGEFVSVSTQRDIESSVIDECISEPKLNGEDDGAGDIKIQISGNADPAVNGTRDILVISPSWTTTKTQRGGSCDMTPRANLSPFQRPARGTKSNLVVSPSRSPSRTTRSESCDLTPGPRSPTTKVVMNDARINRAEEAKEEDDSRKEGLPNPYKAAFASGASFLCGAFLPLLAAMIVSDNIARTVVVVIVASVALILFGGIGAVFGGSSLRASAARVLLGGWISMAVTYSLLKPLDKDDNGGKDKSP